MSKILFIIIINKKQVEYENSKLYFKLLKKSNKTNILEIYHLKNIFI